MGYVICIRDRKLAVWNMIGVLESSNNAVWCPSTLSSLKSISRSIFELESGNKNADRPAHDQTDGYANRQTDTNFENLAHAISYNHGFKSIGGRVFKLESGKHTMDGCVHAQMPKRMDTNFKSNLALVVSYHSVKFQID